MRWPPKALLVWTFQSCLTKAYPLSLKKTLANKSDGDIYTAYGPLLGMLSTLSGVSISCTFQPGLLHTVTQATRCTTPGTAICLEYDGAMQSSRSAESTCCWTCHMQSTWNVYPSEPGNCPLNVVEEKRKNPESGSQGPVF